MIVTKEGSRWKVTPEMQKRVLRVRKEIEKERTDFEKTSQACPTHGDEAEFVRREGAYTRGYAIFRCPKGHDFKVG